MYVTSDMLAAFESVYGAPQERVVRYEMLPADFERLRSSQKHGRRHDVTIFVRKDDRWVVIAKHWYPPGLYRIPSGGLDPREPMVDGILREAYEETGCRIKLRSYFLRIQVEFYCGDQSVNWVSHLVLADWVEGELRPIDTHEIKAVRLAELDEFPRFAEIMLASSTGGFHYRAYLQREAFAVLREIV